MFFSIFLFFIFFTYFLFFVGLGPAQPTWAGLSPAGPAWSLAQASDPAGLHEARVIQITRAWPLLINSTGDKNELAKTQGKTEQTYLVLLQRICARLPKMTLLFSNCLLFLMLVSRVVFLSWVSISSAFVWKIMQVLCFLNFLYSLPVCFCFCCFKASIGKGRVHFWYGVLRT